MPSTPHVISRISAGLLGSYAFTWGFIAVTIAGLPRLGMDFEEANDLAMLLAFLVFLVAFCWAFAAASVARVWIALAGGALLMTGAAWLLSRAA